MISSALISISGSPFSRRNPGWLQDRSETLACPFLHIFAEPFDGPRRGGVEDLAPDPRDEPRQDLRIHGDLRHAPFCRPRGRGPLRSRLLGLPRRGGDRHTAATTPPRRVVRLAQSRQDLREVADAAVLEHDARNRPPNSSRPARARKVGERLALGSAGTAGARKNAFIRGSRETERTMAAALSRNRGHVVVRRRARKKCLRVGARETAHALPPSFRRSPRGAAGGRLR